MEELRDPVRRREVGEKRIMALRSKSAEEYGEADSALFRFARKLARRLGLPSREASREKGTSVLARAAEACSSPSRCAVAAALRYSAWDGRRGSPNRRELVGLE